MFLLMLALVKSGAFSSYDGELGAVSCVEPGRTSQLGTRRVKKRVWVDLGGDGKPGGIVAILECTSTASAHINHKGHASSKMYFLWGKEAKTIFYERRSAAP